MRYSLFSVDVPLFAHLLDSISLSEYKYIMLKSKRSSNVNKRIRLFEAINDTGTIL